jgi:uncharacterized membrane protein HdeD (DUF308 family)
LAACCERPLIDNTTQTGAPGRGRHRQVLLQLDFVFSRAAVLGSCARSRRNTGYIHFGGKRMTDEYQIRRERVQTVATGARTKASDKLASIWWSFLLRGIAAIALGIFAIFWPDMSLRVLVFAVGLYCLADGAAGLVGWLRHPELRENVVQALIILCIGAVLVFWPAATLRTLLGLLGAAALVVGIGQILTARRLPPDEQERSAIMAIGVASVVIGLVLAFWPGSGVAVISWVIGIAVILIGALLIYLGTRFKRLGARIGTPRTR